MSPAARRGWLTPVLVVIAVFQVIIYLFKRNPDTVSVSDVTSYIPSVNVNIHVPDFLKATKKTIATHPIARLMAEGEERHRAMMKRQSRTLNQAVLEYEKRYGMAPPIGFQDWYKFALENNVKIIDEYDSMMDDLKPFRSLSGKELRNRALQVGKLPSIHLVRIKNGKSHVEKIADFKDSEKNARAHGFEVMIEKFIKNLPDMDVPVNAKAEGRILVPWEHQMYPNMTEQDSTRGITAMLDGEFLPDWRGDGNVWEAYRRTCPPTSQARRLFSSLRSKLKDGQQPINRFKGLGISHASETGETDFEFTPGVDDEFDFCKQPWARYKQGHFFSDWRTIPVYYPIFSPAKAKGYGDILIPSHYYYSSTQRYTYGWDPVKKVVYDRAEGETPWKEKTDLIFWRGATTGGGSTPPGFLGEYQRHRFVRMTSGTNSGNRTVAFAWPPSSTKEFREVEVPINDMNRELVDAAFTSAVGCTQYPGGCPEMQRDHRFSDPVPFGEHWRHKYLVDFDGMGYSARSFAFLASDSAVIKSTVYKEFFSDWIQPWMHFIPLSMTYKEIYNIHAYFSGPSQSMLKAANISMEEKDTAMISARESGMQPTPGDTALRKIAMEGKNWKNTVARKVDMEAYVYRLCLEYARLWADDRGAWTYHKP